MEYVVSACLAGIPCRYDGGCSPFSPVMQLVDAGQALPVCPEQLGGLPTPRIPAEIQKGRVINRAGTDVTACYVRGAAKALGLALEQGCTKAVLKARSPSCGPGKIYDGTFCKCLTDGDGLFARALLDAGFIVDTEETFEQQIAGDKIKKDSQTEENGHR